MYFDKNENKVFLYLTNNYNIFLKKSKKSLFKLIYNLN